MAIILPSITTFMTPDWPARIKQLDELNLNQVALFLTGLENIADRERLYQLLSQSNVNSIPHVHLRDNMETWELDLLADKYQAKLFNVHASPAFTEFLERNKQYIPQIFVENGSKIDPYFIKFLNSCAGLCLDFSHWAVGNYLNRPGYELLEDLATKYQIGCAHVSAFIPTGRKLGAHGDDIVRYSPHKFEKLEELSYLQNFKKFLPEYVSLELVNPLAEQLKAINYLQEILQS